MPVKVTFVVYMITIGNYFYYGSSKNYRKRKNDHINRLQKNKHENPIVQNVWNKYSDQFRIKILAKFETKQDMLDAEQRFLDLFVDNEYCMNICKKSTHPNVRQGENHHHYGIGPMKGRKFTQEHKDKIRVANQGKVRSLNQKKQISETVTELWKDPEYRKKISQKKKGRPLSEDHKLAISKGLRNSTKPRTKNRKSRALPVEAIENGVCTIYSSASEAAKVLGVARRTVSSWIQKGKSPKGMYFRYLERNNACAR